MKESKRMTAKSSLTRTVGKKGERRVGALGMRCE